MIRWAIIRWAVFSMCLALIIARQVKPGLINILKSIEIDIFSSSLLAIAALILVQPYLKLFIRNLQFINKRWLLVITCLSLIAIKIAFPNAQVDIHSIWLMGIATLLLLVPDFKSVAAYIKKIKFGDTELELKESIGHLEKEVIKAQDAAAQNQESAVSVNISSEIDKVLEDSRQDPKAALLLLSAKIEHQLRSRLEEANVALGKVFSTARYVEIGVREGVFPEDFFPRLS